MLGKLTQNCASIHEQIKLLHEGEQLLFDFS